MTRRTLTRKSLNTGLEFFKSRLEFLIANTLDLARTQFFGATLQNSECDRFTKRHD